MEMELVGTKIIGLPNGLELICKLFEDETNYKISRAAMLVPTGAGQLGLAEWLPYAKIHKGVIISKNHIMYVVDGNDDVVNKYQTTIGSGIVVPTSSGPVGGDVGGDTSPSLKLTTQDLIVMAKKDAQYDTHVNNMIKVGSPRRSKRKKGNASARTSRSGNGKRIR